MGRCAIGAIFHTVSVETGRARAVGRAEDVPRRVLFHCEEMRELAEQVVARNDDIELRSISWSIHTTTPPPRRHPPRARGTHPTTTGLTPVRRCAYAAACSRAAQAINHANSRQKNPGTIARATSVCNARAQQQSR
uniref:Uncharacterized protein n=1 Tax=Leersia perrieri TaxID=77586 RepID=A0A0D9V553_9ORYZ